jgi:hypothetical protein
MISVRLYLLLFMAFFFSFNSQAQTTRKAKKLERKLIRGLEKEEKVFIKACRKVLTNYSWEAIRPMMDEEKIDFQIDLYMNDDFMFNHLGPAGQRDSSKIHNYYIRESLGLSQMAMEEHIPEGSDLQNVFKLEDLRSIQKIFFIKTELFGAEIKTFYFIAITKDKKRYFGKIWVRDSLDGLKIYGAVG